MVTNISRNPEETFQLGVAWGRTAPPGLVIGLIGDLGSGKTQLVKGIAHGMAFVGRVTSPTFTLVQIYEGGRMPVYHLDLYRLNSETEILAAGLDEFLRPKGLTVIEWMDRWPNAQPEKFRRVTLETTSESERRIHHEDLGN